MKYRNLAGILKEFYGANLDPIFGNVELEEKDGEVIINKWDVPNVEQPSIPQALARENEYLVKKTTNPDKTGFKKQLEELPELSKTRLYDSIISWLKEDPKRIEKLNNALTVAV